MRIKKGDYGLPVPSATLRVTFIGVAFTVFGLLGCGGASQPPIRGQGSGAGSSTSVTVFLSANANDQLTNFFLALDSLTLTTDSGEQVNLFEDPQYVEFLHLNGKPEPLTTVTIPQGVYTAATATVGSGDFVCYGFDTANGDVASGLYGLQQVPNSGAEVSLQPITIAGTTQSLMLELQVSQSASWPTCDGTENNQTWSITPTFVLSAMSNDDPAVANVRGLRGLVSGIDPSGSGFTVTSANIPLWETNPPGPAWHILRNGSEVYQGITDFSQLAVGMDVDVDASVGDDGSLTASRVSVYDANSNDLSVSIGPLLRIWASAPPYLYASGNYAEGVLPGWTGAAPFGFAGSVFQISSELANLPSLPFSASFTASNMVAGQNTLITTHVPALSSNTPYVPATTITLIPQTLDGTVSAIGSDGGFTTYTITLAPYDLFPALAVQPGQTTILNNPNTVIVYADDNTQMLNTNPIAVGGVARFYGLLFDDNGTLRMDCGEILDGVPE